MATCALCGKIGVTPHILDGKEYGSECYKKALAIKFGNHDFSEWTTKIEILLVVARKSEKKIIKDIINFYDIKRRMSSNQFNCIIANMTEDEKAEYTLNKINITNDNIFYLDINKYNMYNFYNDVRLCNYCNRVIENSKSIKSIIHIRYIEDGHIKSILKSLTRYGQLKINELINFYKEDEELGYISDFEYKIY